MLTNDETVSVAEAAKKLGISRQMLTQLIRRGDMPATKIFGMWRVRTRDVETAKAAPEAHRA